MLTNHKWFVSPKKIFLTFIPFGKPVTIENESAKYLIEIIYFLFRIDLVFLLNSLFFYKKLAILNIISVFFPLVPASYNTSLFTTSTQVLTLVYVLSSQ